MILKYSEPMFGDLVEYQSITRFIFTDTHYHKNYYFSRANVNNMRLNNF